MAKILDFKGKGDDIMEHPSVFNVAEYFLSLVDAESGSVMTHLKLQKLCYYAQAWHLVFDNVSLFPQRFEAWAHGPVCPDLFYVYKDFGRFPLPLPDEIDDSEFTESQIETLEAVWEAYGQFDAKYLEELTHHEDPWIIARGNFPPGERCNNVITLESMKEYYTKQQNG